MHWFNADLNASTFLLDIINETKILVVVVYVSNLLGRMSVQMKSISPVIL